MTPVRVNLSSRGARLVMLGAIIFMFNIGLTVFAGPAIAMPSSKPFEILPGTFHLSSSTNQAGSHENLTTAFDFAHSASGKTFNDVRTTIVNLPPGFVGNNTAVPACPPSLLLAQSVEKGSECPVDTQVGTISLDLTVEDVPVYVTFPVYNVEVTSPGVTAELGFNAIIFSQVLSVNVRPDDLGLTVTGSDIEDIGEPHNISVTIWGVPFAHEHDAERGKQCYPSPLSAPVATCVGGGQVIDIPPKPYLSTPTSCPETSLVATMEARSWEEAGNWSKQSAEVAPSVECDRVPFNPSIEVRPTTDLAESPSGLDVSLIVPQNWEKPETISTSNLKDARVTLPEGYTVNPSAGSGLAACTPEDLARETAASQPGEGCPSESKIGSVEIETPVLTEKAFGAVYIAKPFENPFDSLLALYIVAKIPSRGIVVKVAGRIELNERTGQLVTTFDNNPQVPFSKFTLKFRQGATSPLASPSLCGNYNVIADLTPWSAPSEPRSISESFAIDRGVHGGACPTGGLPPFKPTVLAGSDNNAADAYSPFYLRISREDGEQEITKFSTTLPPGLTGNLSGVSLCSDQAVEAARHVTGLQEISEPSCPVTSEIGHTLVGAGVGSVLAWTPGKVYLAGPYKGAPLSIVSVTSATVGPFDLGTVVIRFGLRINPRTAQVEVDSSGSDPIPHIIDGIVVHVREIHVYIDRSRFILNPTSCARMSISNVITGTGANFAALTSEVPVTVTTPFQAADCQNLSFKPSFKVSTSGKTSRSKGASLSVKLSYPNLPQGTQSNIRSVKVDLPKQLPSRLTTLQKACVDATFNANPAACPAGSRVGTASAITPILPVPLTGPAYFVSHGGAKFPELIVVLQGYGITIELHGETFISSKGITSSTFRTVPDQPVTSFELTLPQGANSALAANGNLCALTRVITQRKKTVRRVAGSNKTFVKVIRKRVSAKLEMPTIFTAQNGMVVRRSTPITVTGCQKKRGRNQASGQKRRKK